MWAPWAGAGAAADADGNPGSSMGVYLESISGGRL